MSRKEKQLNVRKSVRDTDFWTEKGVSRKGKLPNVRKSVRDTRFSAEKGVSREEQEGSGK